MVMATSRTRTPLGELIQARLDATGWSRRKFAQEASCSRTHVTNLMFGPLTNMPDTGTLRHLSAALAVPEHVVVAAALETVGLAHPGGRRTTLEDAIAEAPFLNDSDKEGLRAMVQAKRRRRA